MSNLFKVLAVIAAAFTFSSPAFSGTIVGCKMEGGILKKSSAIPLMKCLGLALTIG